MSSESQPLPTILIPCSQEITMALQEFTNPVKSRDDIDEQVGFGEG